MHSEPFPPAVAADNPPLSIATQVDGPSTVRLFVSGDLETCTARLLHAAVLDALRRYRPVDIFADLWEVDFFDVRGVRTLLACQADAAQVGCEFTVVHPSPRVTSVLAAMGMQETFGLSAPGVVKPCAST